MSMPRISLLPCNFVLPFHRKAFVGILRSYMLDPMGDAEPLSEAREIQVMEAIWNHPCHYVQFASIENCIAGMAVCFLNYSTFRAAPFYNIHDIAVLPEFRNRGIGTALIHGVTLRALYKGCCKVTLEVRQDNEKAYALYRRLAFRSCTPKMEYLYKDLPQGATDITPKRHIHKVS